MPSKRVRSEVRKDHVCLGRMGTLDERFDIKIQRDANGCWRWIGSLNGFGYGQFWDGAKLWRAHRWAYTRFVGPIPAGMQLDHTCSVRDCVNPDHLEPVTNAENSRRALERRRLSSVG